MTIPNYKAFMRPLLEVAKTKDYWRTGDLQDAVADHVGLSSEDMAELLPSGKQATYANRSGWAKTYLAKAGLLESPRRGWVQITERGLAALDSGKQIDTRACSH